MKAVVSLLRFMFRPDLILFQFVLLLLSFGLRQKNRLLHPMFFQCLRRIEDDIC